MCVQRLSACSALSDVLRVPASAKQPALYAALARIEDLRVGEPRVK